MNNNSKVLALKYRPQVFDDLIGQEVVAETITNSIKTDKIPMKSKRGKWNKTIEMMWRNLVYAALLVYTNKTKNLIGNSTHYYAYNKVNPRWANYLVEHSKIGGHRFMYYD